MQTIKINKCEGYLWKSDAQKPQVYQGEPIDICFDETKNPFFVEGQLFDRENMESYSIKYVDGKYQITPFEVKKGDFINPNYELKTYYANRMGNLRLNFLRYWEEIPDKNCLGIPVLTLTKNVFVGFKDKENKL